MSCMNLILAIVDIFIIFLNTYVYFYFQLATRNNLNNLNNSLIYLRLQDDTTIRGITI